MSSSSTAMLVSGAIDEESKTIELLEYKSKCITTIDDKWISEWTILIEKYFKFEKRNHIRLKAIALLSQIFSKYHVICEDELMNKLILPNFQDYTDDCHQNSTDDSVIRKPIVHLLFDIANCCHSYKHCNAILAIIRKILIKPYKMQQIKLNANDEPNSATNHSSNQATITNQPSEKSNDNSSPSVYVIGNVDIIDSRLIISNLNKLFRVKLFKLPIDPAVNMLDIAVNYLSLTYKYPLQDPVPAEVPMIRRELFSLFLNLRCNKYGHLGINDCQRHQAHHLNLSNQQSQNNSNSAQQNGFQYSPFIICFKRPRLQPDQGQPISPTSQSPVPIAPDSPTLLMAPANQHNFLKSTNHSSSQSPQAHHNQSHHSNHGYQNIFVPNASHPNCPIVSRCVNLDAMFAGIIDCVEQESDFDVLKMVLDGLPGLLANKSLVLTTTDEKINQLCIALSDLIRSSRSCNQRQNSRVDIIKCGLRCLTSLLIYRKLLDQKSIRFMLSAFEDSLKVTSHHQPIVPLFTTCLIELQDSCEMTKFLPVVLTRLSKFTPTLNLGIGMLEFLSYLILFPKLYENFSEDEYKFIFAIALPYTNPFRFSDFITCLAFRVIAIWYLNCRPTLRCAFVELVKKSLQSNVIQPFKENFSSSSSTTTTAAAAAMASGQTTAAQSNIYSTSATNYHHQHHYNQTSPNPITQTPPIIHSSMIASPVDHRKRSSSLNTENSFRHQQAALGLTNQQSSLQVNEELIETFADLLSRYTHGQCIAVAPKNKSTEQLIDRSTSQTWLHGNSLITITSCDSNHGWAEIMIRRPTGNTSWIGRLQNSLGSLPMCLNQQVYLDSLNFANDVISLFSAMTFNDNSTSNGQSPAQDKNNDFKPIQSSSSALSFASNSSGIGGSNAISGSVSNISSTTATPSSASNLSASSSISTSTLNITSSCPPNCKQLHPHAPIPLPKDKKFDIALSNFDHITPYETHKIGVVYVGRNQSDNRAAILANKCGSMRYYDFLKNIGTCIILNDIDPEVYFIGGLDAKGADGKYAYFWKDNLTQVIFHVTTFMPARESDPQCNNKNRHIGNDHVCIVYNDSKQQFQLSTIKGTGQFITACIVITPLEESSNIVEVEILPDLRYIVGDIEAKVLSNLGASLYARQMAIHLNLASKIHERRQCEGFFNKEPYVSNWVERLRCIKRIRQRLEEARRAAGSGNSIPLK